MHINHTGRVSRLFINWSAGTLYMRTLAVMPCDNFDKKVKDELGLDDESLEGNELSSFRAFSSHFILRDILQTHFFWNGTRRYVRVCLVISNGINPSHFDTYFKKKGTDKTSNLNDRLLCNDKLDLFGSDIVERFSLSMEWKHLLFAMSDRDKNQ